jgi:D-alanyl-lipoteichoic acid acyltransferase DltB (MBOAT superfamily)
MTFNSLEYWIFLPLIWLLYISVTRRMRWCVLLLGSYLFYAWLKIPYLIAVLGLSTAITYICGILMCESASPGRKRLILWLGVGLNVASLVVVKYLPFLGRNIEMVSGWLFPHTVEVNAPLFIGIGVSYFTFQAVSYLADIYLEIRKPERHAGIFALYMAFFPKLLQGPIERASDLIPQLHTRYYFSYTHMRYAALLFGWGLFKKVAVADRLGIYVDTVYAAPHNFQAFTNLLATYAYAFQIYFDFSAYTDMALASALIFNIELTDNFNRPYLATSVAEFWRRWHITFSRWILDYIFKPLQMRWRNLRNYATAAALMVTFTVSGIWHGASWNFVLWGILHGVYLSTAVFYRPYQKTIQRTLRLENTRMLKIWQVICTFHLVTFAWIFFRTQDLKHAWSILKGVGGVADAGTAGLIPAMEQIRHIVTTSVPQGEYQLILFGASVAVLMLIQFPGLKRVQQQRWFVRWGVYLVLLAGIIMGRVPAGGDFIYFRF